MIYFLLAAEEFLLNVVTAWPNRRVSPLNWRRWEDSYIAPLRTASSLRNNGLPGSCGNLFSLGCLLRGKMDVVR